MRTLLLLAFCLFPASGLMAQKMMFGEAPEDKVALALRDRIVETYRAQGIPAAIKILDTEGAKFIAAGGATARYDFVSALNMEAMGKDGSGSKDRDWKLALIEWCYGYCRKEGKSYWYGWFVPTMHELYFTAGKYGSARAVIDYEQSRRLESGDELDVRKLTVVGSVNKDFPAIQKRTLGPDRRIMMKEFRFFVSQAQQDIMEGKWRQGMEATALAADRAMGDFKWSKARPENIDSKLAMTNYTGHWRRAKLLSAMGFRFLGLPELELKECEELAKFNIEEGRGLYDVQMGRARELHLKYLLGTADVAVVEKMGEIRALQRSEAYKAEEDADRVYLMIADVHFRQANTKRGWEVIDEIRARESHSRDMKFEVDSEWCRHRVDTGLTEGVEAILINLLKIAREGGLKQREIELYETYARLLVALGRYEDALVIQRELIRLLKSFDLFPRLPGALHYLAGIHSLLGERDKAAAEIKEANSELDNSKLPESSKTRLRKVIEEPLPGASDNHKPKETNVDLQPQRSMMVPLEGLPARGLFTLTNHTGKEVSGVIRFLGEGLAYRENQAEMIGLDVSVPGGRAELARQVTIPAGDFIAIDLSRSPGAADNAKVSIIWSPKTGESQTAEWTAEPAEKGVSIAITDASQYLNNPFYLIPMYHLLQYKDAFAQVADVRVIASYPTRIELYDQDDELIFVDADGDGEFNSEGDMISKDVNRNSRGDLTLEATRQEMRFRLFVRPAEVKPGQELSLNLQLFQQGEWVTHSTDRLIFPKEKK
jgi:tetratricopeptide (TPR) repeat protein